MFSEEMTTFHLHRERRDITRMILHLKHDFHMGHTAISKELAIYGIQRPPQTVGAIYRQAWRAGLRPTMPDTPEWMYQLERFRDA